MLGCGSWFFGGPRRIGHSVLRRTRDPPGPPKSQINRPFTMVVGMKVVVLGALNFEAVGVAGFPLLQKAECLRIDFPAWGSLGRRFHFLIEVMSVPNSM